MDRGKRSRDRRGGSRTKVILTWDFGTEQYTDIPRAKSFCPLSSRDFRRELLCSMDLPWLQEHYKGRVAWSARGVS